MDRWEVATYIVAAVFIVFVISYAESLRGSQPTNINISQPTFTSTSTITVTTTQTLNSTSTLSGGKAIYGIIYDVWFIAEGGQWTVISLMTPDADGLAECCDIWVFDGFVQGVPLGEKVMIVYLEYFEGFQRHLVVSDIREMN